MCESCPSGWTSYGSSCYMMVKTNLTYTDSLFNCNKLGYGATLAIPNSDEELAYLKNITLGLATSTFVSI